ncbi:transglutaminase family protein [Marinococcus sp. PL1-022]|uniref:transglutaminase-like domain-containing protein n=1 Tax=Marinococcus sp. PL1-022 TaxID=3095363 RepID=UPI0029C5EB36|nr:transglutaminase family protein [Marinococcus sp. PL1-022]MDX6153886.1 transglutaminase family protein [Marinococcus sp. PL1-022]
MKKYLQATYDVNYEAESIQQKATELFFPEMNEKEKIESAYIFVRDEVSHSWDIQGETVTRRASEVLKYREGICWAKSHLLAALLRSEGIPCGFCYQRLTLFVEPAGGYCIHALNAVYLNGEDRWVRLDARGNKPGIDAQFFTDKEQLAFNVEEAKDEWNYPAIYAETPAELLDILDRYGDPVYMYRYALPESLSVKVN